MNAADDLLDLLALRFSVGPKYLTPPGPSAEQWARASDLALRAPDHGGLRPFRFVVVGVAVLFVQIGALSPETQYPCGFTAVATPAR